MRGAMGAAALQESDGNGIDGDVAPAAMAERMPDGDVIELDDDDGAAAATGKPERDVAPCAAALQEPDNEELFIGVDPLTAGVEALLLEPDCRRILWDGVLTALAKEFFLRRGN
eukprot:s3084_g6.t1